MKVIITTSDKYFHLLKITCFLLQKNWKNQQFQIVCYNGTLRQISELSEEMIGKLFPSSIFSFYSMGDQSDTNKDFSNDLRKYFELQRGWFTWIFDDTFVRGIDQRKLDILISYTTFRCIDKLGKINLSNDSTKHDHIPYSTIDGYDIIENTQTALYRLSTQPSIWNKDFLLQYLKPDLSPWDFETQDSFNDGWKVIGPIDAAIDHNEGVCKRDLYDYNLSKIEESQIQEMKELKLI